MVLTLVDYERLSNQHHSLKCLVYVCLVLDEVFHTMKIYRLRDQALRNLLMIFRKIIKVIQVCFYWNILIKNN